MIEKVKLSARHISVDESDQRKYSYLAKVIELNYPPNSELDADFLRFLSSEDCYKYSPHFLRYYITFSEMAKMLKGACKGKVLIETGGVCPITDYLTNNNDCFYTETDLREKINCKDDFADIVFSFEVLEHIKDRPENNFDEIVLFQESGAEQYIREMERVLRPDGFLFLTTPNPCGLYSLQRLLRGESPMVFRPHVREYSKQEILKFFRLELVFHRTMHNFFNLHDGDQLSKNLFAQFGASADDRGDDHFFCFKKIP